MARINRQLATELAATVRPQRKECFRNSVQALCAYHGDADAVYVEGLLIILRGTLPIDHGWLEIGGAIVDVTLDDCEAGDYHPVLRYTRDEAQKLVHKRGLVPFFANSEQGRKTMRDAEWAWWQERMVVPT